MKVLKFGGSSVGKPERIRSIVAILQKYQARGDQFTVVFSAFGGVTDGLIDMATKAERGDAGYVSAFEAVKKRHVDSARELLSDAGFDAIMPLILKNTDDLNGVLRGIFLIHEVSPRTLDYVQIVGIFQNQRHYCIKTIVR